MLFLMRCRGQTRSNIGLVIFCVFLKVCHSGVATKETFCAALSYVFHEAADDNFFCEDFVQTLSRLLHGTREEILNWVFDLYDFDKDGYISRQELTALIRAVHNLLGAPHGSRGSVEDIDEKVNWMFNKFDVDRDGKIGRREFITICLQDQIILESLKAFGNSL
ncbi:Kv channel-interacting protein [Echinococcus granulosus]|uniref:Kv channel-interacting protein n=1 Tax=Echinococcus granulosus TaxID=6210 RepID=W6USM2_ECHGR|nr:Kv channel-interacting protein [Echinococcus granulosus]EUB64283.1 Kv channel-interacting protein [Echinococcus granulosus]